MLKKAVKTFLRKLGYKIRKDRSFDNPLENIKRLLINIPNPIIFDIGANVGQSIDRFRTYFPGSIIYSFEPGTNTFIELSKKHSNTKDIHLENRAIGSEVSKKYFFENEYSDMSSFLEFDRPASHGIIKNIVEIETETIDNYCKKKFIPKIDILKSDTQGFELEVYRGAIEMMKSNNIYLVYFEFIFSDMYKSLPSFGEIYQLLFDNNFRLVNIYDFHYENGLISWADLLFINSDYDRKK